MFRLQSHHQAEICSKNLLRLIEFAAAAMQFIIPYREPLSRRGGEEILTHWVIH